MLEGVELEGKIGNIGKYSVDVNDQLNLDIMVGFHFSVLDYLKELAAKTGTPVDDVAISWIEKVLNAKKA